METNLRNHPDTQARMVIEAPVAEFHSPQRGIQMLQMLNIVPNSAPISLALSAKHQTTLAQATKAGMPVQFLGYAPIYEGTKIFHGLSNDWALMNIQEDRIMQLHGKYPMPRVVVQALRKAVKSGVDFDAVFVAHEIPAGSVRPGEPVPLELIMPPPSRKTQDRLHGLDGTISALWMSGAVVATTPLALVGFAAAIARFDPILFGLHINDQNQAGSEPFAMWYYLTQWVWDTGE